MTMYARIEQGVVREIVDTTEPIQELYHPDLLWIDVRGRSEITPGWIVGPDGFSAPEPEELLIATPEIDIGELLQRVRDLEQQVRMLIPSTTDKQPG